MEGLITLGKDVLYRLEKSGVIYKLICKRCKVTYVSCWRSVERDLRPRMEGDRRCNNCLIFL